MKKMFSILMVGAVLLAGYSVWQFVGQTAIAQTQKKQAPPPEVDVYTVVPQKVHLQTELPGRVSAFQTAEIRPQVSGIIKKRLFTEGAEVCAGDPLYLIDPDTYQVAVNRASAALAKAKAQLEPTRLKARRFQTLLEAKAVSAQDNDEVQAQFALAKASVMSAQAELQAARIDLRRTTVSSPITGRIGRSAMTPGALVTTNQLQALATVRQLDPVYVDVTRSYDELLELKRQLRGGTMQHSETAKTSVRLLFDDGREYAEQGVLELSEASVDTQTGTVVLRVVFPNPGRDLLPGMYIRAVLGEGILPEALCVPQQSVLRSPLGQPLVMVVEANNTIGVRPLQLGKAIDDSWLVQKGLERGARVVTKGLQKVRPGMQVRVSSEK